MPNEESDAKRHSRGAIVVHHNPFSSLPRLPDTGSHDKAFIQEWVIPHYMDLNKREHSIKMIDAANQANIKLVEHLLGWPNWRPRTVGTHLAALKQLRVLEPTIINLMLQSDLCYVGRDYALTLASFGTSTAIDAFERYLEYYLRQPNLWFNQADVLAAVGWLDEKHGTCHMKKWLPLWDVFITNKPNWSLSKTRQHFDSSMQLLLQRRQALIGL